MANQQKDKIPTTRLMAVLPRKPYFPVFSSGIHDNDFNLKNQQPQIVQK
jgi:hypothetical protein